MPAAQCYNTGEACTSIPFEMKVLILDMAKSLPTDLTHVLGFLVDQHVFGDVRLLTAPGKKEQRHPQL